MNSLESFAKFVPAANNVTLNPMGSVILTDMEAKARRFVNSLNDVLYETSNEPSLGFYRIQVRHNISNFCVNLNYAKWYILKEHVRKSIPNLIEKKADLDNVGAQIKGTSFDLVYSIDAVSKMANAEQTLEV